jgi:hypothetical protein
MPPIRTHPQNPRLFEFRGRPLVLITATEHYGAVMNRPFRFERYLRDTAQRGITLTRLFVLFRELQTPINPYSTCKPESPDYIAPFTRTGPGRALDGELQYDLDRPNPEFFERIHRFMGMASNLGIIVEVVLLSNVYNQHVWALNPLHPQNNVNQLAPIAWHETMTMRHPALFERQTAHIRRIVSELNRYDNLIYEICNEPFGNADEANAPTPDDVNAWLAALIRTVRETENALPRQHLIAGQQAYSWKPFEQGSDLAFRTLDYDIVNMHPLPNSTYGGRSYQLGDFMSKQAVLRALRDFGLAVSGEPKPLNQDEDNVASQYKDVDGWTIHRKRAWITLLTGGHYDFIDFSIIPRLETGTRESRRCIRRWIGHLARYIHTLDLVRSRPLVGVVQSAPTHILDVTFGIPGEDYTIYLADERELSDAHVTMLSSPADLENVARDPGGSIQGDLIVQLPEGSYTVVVYDPKQDQFSPALPLRGGAETHIHLLPFVHDLVVRIRRA